LAAQLLLDKAKLADLAKDTFEFEAEDDSDNLKRKKQVAGKHGAQAPNIDRDGLHTNHDKGHHC
jgi:hypothetical protein